VYHFTEIVYARVYWFFGIL